MKTDTKIPHIRRHETTWRDRFETIAAYGLYPFWKLGQGLVQLFNWICFEKYRTGDNHVCGPGYRVYYETKFAWGKLTFICFIIFVIIYFITK